MSLTAERAMPSFARHRRLRRTPGMRRLVRETRLDPASLVLPLFVDARIVRPEPIGSLPGHSRWPVARAPEIAERAARAGIGGLLLFGLPAEKDERGSAAGDERGPVPAALRAIRAATPELVLIADVCLCEYTSHGHCGLLDADGGADIVAPSDMMDGRVAAIRASLDANGYADAAILSYAAKYASAFYGPFREAAECAPSFGDRAGYQMDPPNGREALAEITSDIAQGADLVMVKPAGPYLDVIAAARARFDLPVAAYQVSGEYAALHAAADRGWLDLERAARESLAAIARAGAGPIVSYFALDAASWDRER